MADLTLWLAYDPGPSDPNKGQYGWRLVSFCSRHSHFGEPALYLGPRNKRGDPKPANRGVANRLDAGTAFVLSYFEHGDCVWFRKNSGNVHASLSDFRWDGVAVAGYLYHDGRCSGLPKGLDARREDADRFLRRYTNWANGHVYCWRLEDSDGDTVAEGWDCNDEQDMLADIKAEVRHHRILWLAGDLTDIAATLFPEAQRAQ